MFLWAKIELKKKYIVNSVRTKKLLKIKVKILESIFFFGLKTVSFRASCFGYRIKGVCPLLLPLVSLVRGQKVVYYYRKVRFSAELIYRRLDHRSATLVSTLCRHPLHYSLSQKIC